MVGPSRNVCGAIGALLLLLSSCASSRGEPNVVGRLETEIPAVRADATEAELTERLAAAGRVAGMQAREHAFLSIALDAAASLRLEHCLEALGGVRRVELRDDCAAKAALLVRRRGDLTGARRLAEEVRSVPLRDAVFSAIAAGPSVANHGRP